MRTAIEREDSKMTIETTTSYTTIAIVPALALLAGAVVVVTVVSFTVQPAYAFVPTCTVCGASELAPGEEAKIPVFCQECAKDFSPGQEGLETGIIGPDLKK